MRGSVVPAIRLTLENSACPYFPPSHGAIVLVDTGFAKFWPSRKDYLGTELRGQAGVQALHFPGLHPEAATWLVRERQVKAIGIDTASIDYGQSAKFETHIALLSQKRPGVRESCQSTRPAAS
ncbi:MAG: hypothetical protein HC938_01335, partial [Nitrospira sp.]|nr:hypothetical protein [Nitrospira sp.]